MTVHITDDELVRDFAGVMAKLRLGDEIIVEHYRRPVAVIRSPQAPGRKISECLDLARTYEWRLGHAPVPDPDFAKDVKAAIDAHPEPLSPPVEPANTLRG
jgi:hypothetical protein